MGSFSKGKGISNSDKKEKGFPCITYGEIYTTHDYVIKDFSSFTDIETAKKSQRIKKNDVLFAGSGETLDEIGKCVAFTKNVEAYAAKEDATEADFGKTAQAEVRDPEVLADKVGNGNAGHVHQL